MAQEQFNKNDAETAAITSDPPILANDDNDNQQNINLGSAKQIPKNMPPETIPHLPLSTPIISPSPPVISSLSPSPAETSPQSSPQIELHPINNKVQPRVRVTPQHYKPNSNNFADPLSQPIWFLWSNNTKYTGIVKEKINNTGKYLVNETAGGSQCEIILSERTFKEKKWGFDTTYMPKNNDTNNSADVSQLNADEYSYLIKQKKTPNCQICKQDPNIKTDCNGHGPIGLQLSRREGDESTNKGIYISEVAKGSATDVHNLIQPGDMVVGVNKTRLYLSDKLDACVECIKTSLGKSGEVLLTFKDSRGADHLKQRLQKREIEIKNEKIREEERKKADELLKIAEISVEGTKTWEKLIERDNLRTNSLLNSLQSNNIIAKRASNTRNLLRCATDTFNNANSLVGSDNCLYENKNELKNGQKQAFRLYQSNLSCANIQREKQQNKKRKLRNIKMELQKNINGHNNKKKNDKKKRSKVFKGEIESIMYGYGDCFTPLKESVDLLENIAVEYMQKLTSDALKVAAKRGQLDTGAFVFLIRKDPVKFARLRELLKMNAELKKNKPQSMLDLEIPRQKQNCNPSSPKAFFDVLDTDTRELLEGPQLKKPKKLKKHHHHHNDNNNDNNNNNNNQNNNEQNHENNNSKQKNATDEIIAKKKNNLMMEFYEEDYD